MESQRVVVVVEEVEAARAAVRWAAHNLLRGGDTITLVYVCPVTRSKAKGRSLRRRGFQLALSFKDTCNGIAEAKVEIIVTEGDQGAVIAAVVNNVRASTLIAGLHRQSFLYKIDIPSSLSCRILAIRQHSSSSPGNGFASIEISQVEITRLGNSAKNSSLLCPLCFGIAGRRSRRRN